MNSFNLLPSIYDGILLGSKFCILSEQSNMTKCEMGEGLYDDGGYFIVKGNDGGSEITALTLDMSAAGAATFNNDVTAFSDKRLKTKI